MRYHLMGGQSFSLRAPNILHPDLKDLLNTWVLPDVGQYFVIPSAAHLPASVETVKTIESYPHHYVLENKIRQHEPVANN